MLPALIIFLASLVFLNASLYLLGIGFYFGWLGALAVMYIPFELEERKRLQRKKHNTLKEIHQIIGEHHKQRNGIEL